MTADLYADLVAAKDAADLALSGGNPAAVNALALYFAGEEESSLASLDTTTGVVSWIQDAQASLPRMVLDVPRLQAGGQARSGGITPTHYRATLNGYYLFALTYRDGGFELAGLESATLFVRRYIQELAKLDRVRIQSAEILTPPLRPANLELVEVGLSVELITRYPQC